MRATSNHQLYGTTRTDCQPSIFVRSPVDAMTYTMKLSVLAGGRVNCEVTVPVLSVCPEVACSGDCVCEVTPTVYQRKFMGCPGMDEPLEGVNVALAVATPLTAVGAETDSVPDVSSPHPNIHRLNITHTTNSFFIRQLR